ncbi:MAG TPA: Fur family transcriptional regulator [Gaiellaceae bacterium]|nr:Fur family transcriptional regulator [Gaiellaceae bacterium]
MPSSEQTQAVGLLTGVGVRPTRQRVVVLTELMGERNDVTAQELHERLRVRGERLGLATVYRTLGLLADEGVIDSLSHRPGELCYRLCGEGHHHHLVCSGCHQVVELDECELEPWLKRISEAHGFVTTGHRLEVAGLCGDCR